jgi:hypothetical protein
MKIIQTLWLPNSHENPISYTGGWLSPEYHWLSWTLSVLQLRKFYNEVELFTTQAGKEILINQLNLPYTKVHLVLDEANIPQDAWALSKVITYSLQNEPFLHVDGDVFIWKSFDKELLEKPLITQNQEYNFPFYQNYIENKKNQVSHLPFLKQEEIKSPIITYNAGIFGGNDLEFIKKYARIATDYVNNNPMLPLEQSSEYCMFFEQFIFSMLVDDAKISVGTYFQEIVYSELYKELGLSDFWETPHSKSYLHLMGMTKKNRMILKNMLNKIKIEYPEYYYNTLRICQESGVILDFQVYQLHELKPSTHSYEYFTEISKKVALNQCFENQNKWLYLYAKDTWVYKQMEKFTLLSEEEKYKIQLFLSNDFELIENESPDLKQYLRITDTFSVDFYDHELDEIEILLINTFDKIPKTINHVLGEIQSYFNDDDFIENQTLLKKLILTKVIQFMNMGVVCIVE